MLCSSSQLKLFKVAKWTKHVFQRKWILWISDFDSNVVGFFSWLPFCCLVLHLHGVGWIALAVDVFFSFFACCYFFSAEPMHTRCKWNRDTWLGLFVDKIAPLHKHWALSNSQFVCGASECRFIIIEEHIIHSPLFFSSSPISFLPPPLAACSLYDCQRVTLQWKFHFVFIIIIRRYDKWTIHTVPNDEWPTEFGSASRRQF